MANSNVGAVNPFSVQEPLFNTPGDGAGGGAGDGAGAGSGDGNGQGGSQNAPGGGQQPVGDGQGQGQGSGQGQGTSFSYKEDRSDWIPRHRLNEATGKLSKEIEALKTQLGGNTDIVEKLKQVFNPASAQDQNTQEIKQAILQMFPGLEGFGNLTKDQIDELLQAGRDAQSSTQNHWKQHATRMLDSLQKEVQTALGAEKLTDTQIRSLRTMYREELARAVAARQRAQQTGEPYDDSKDALARHEAGDIAFIKEFAKAFLDDWFEPARRSATAAALRRTTRPVPQGGRQTSTVTTKAPEIDYNDEAAFKKALAEARGQG